jgi:hypothetical protein
MKSLNVRIAGTVSALLLFSTCIYAGDNSSSIRADKPMAASSDDSTWVSLLNRPEFTKNMKVAEIPLTSATVSPYEEVRTVTGGSFVEGGWKATDSLCRIVMVLERGFKYNESGAIEIEMTNLDPVEQQKGRKHHFFNLYANPEGSTWHRYFLEPDRKNKVGVNVPEPYFNLRFGNYGEAQGGRSIKVLWQGGGKRHEVSHHNQVPFGLIKNWDKNKVYTYRVEWDTKQLVVYLDDELIFASQRFNNMEKFGPDSFADRDKNAPMKYVFISRDNHDNPAVWYGMPGPVYKKVRVYYGSE